MYFKTIFEILNYLEKKRTFSGINFGLTRMQNACCLLDNPQNKINSIHFAGSNGKGSTLNYTKKILLKKGYSVGVFMSPEQNIVYDQITINDISMTEDEFLHECNEIINILGRNNPLSEFEFITVLAFHYLAKHNLDFVLIETGMGGKLDATNICNPLISVITTISLEHQKFLGNTVEEIAIEKAGIIKPNRPVVIGKATPNILQILQTQAKENCANAYALGIDYKFQEIAPNQFLFSYQNETISKITLSMLGNHQADNCATAIMTCKLLDEIGYAKISDDDIRIGAAKCQFPGRFEIVRKKPLIIFDGAHNPSGIKVFCHTMRKLFPNYKKTIIFSCFNDKDATSMIAELDKIADKLLLTEMKHPRTAFAKDLFLLSSLSVKQIVPDIGETLSADIAENELVGVVGSLHLLKEAKKIFKKVDKLC